MAATTLVVGDISIIGYSSDAPDEFSFVLWTDVDATTTINFTDRGWRAAAGEFTKNPSEAPGATSSSPADGEVSWTSGQAIPAGTIVTGTFSSDNPDTVSWDLGVASGDFGNTGLSSTGESIFAYQGSLTSPSLLFGLYFHDGAWDSTDPGEFSTTDSELPSALNVPNGNIVVPASSSLNDNGVYNGPFTGEGSFNDYRALVNDRTQWTVSNTSPSTSLGSNFPAGGFVVPEPSSALLALVASGLMMGRRAHRQ